MTTTTTTSIVPAKYGTVSETALQLRDDLSFEEWMDVGAVLRQLEKSIGWWIGDWWNYGERRYGERIEAARGHPVLSQYAAGTLRQYGWVSRAYEPSRRLDDLSHSHHQEALAAPKDERVAVLEKARDEGWSARAVRNELKRRALDENPPLPPGKWKRLKKGLLRSYMRVASYEAKQAAMGLLNTGRAAANAKAAGHGEALAMACAQTTADELPLTAAIIDRLASIAGSPPHEPLDEVPAELAARLFEGVLAELTLPDLDGLCACARIACAIDGDDPPTEGVTPESVRLWHTLFMPPGARTGTEGQPGGCRIA